MAQYCEDCGSKVFNGRCVNCHEELYIFDQYIKQGMELPKDDTEFMQKVFEQSATIKNNNPLT